MKQGRLICLEGIEGTGKTTQIHFIADYIKQSLHQPVVTTREPGGTALAESIRHLILEARTDKELIASETELFLLFAARRQHITRLIQPALQDGYWVICDRFTEASYAYQGGGRGIPSDLIDCLNAYTCQQVSIDRVILLDMPIQEALDRLKKQRRRTHQTLDRIELESSMFFERVRQSYLDRAQMFPERYRVVDARLTINEVQSQIIAVLDELLLQQPT